MTAVTIPSQIRWVQYVERMLKAVRDGPSGMCAPSCRHHLRCDHGLNGSGLCTGTGSSNPSADVSLAQIGAKIANVLGLLSIRIHGIPFAVRSANANIWFVITKPGKCTSDSLSVLVLPSLHDSSEWWRGPGAGDETFKFSSRKSIKPARFDGNTDAMVFMVPPGKKVVMQEDVKVEFFHGSTMFKKVVHCSAVSYATLALCWIDADTVCGLHLPTPTPAPVPLLVQHSLRAAGCQE